MLLVIVEHDNGELVEAAKEALTFGRVLAEKMDDDLEAALIGSDDAGLVAAAGEFGADTVHTCTHDLLRDYGPDAHGAVIAQMVEELKPAAVLACGSDRGNEFMAQAAARLAVPFVANCVDVTPGESWSMTRVQWGGSLLEDLALDAEVPLLTCGLHAVAAEVGGAGDGDAESFDADLDDSVTITMVKDRVVLEAGVTLPTAPVVCGGGRGVGSADGFAPLEELAALLNGRVGCSRSPTTVGVPTPTKSARPAPGSLQRSTLRRASPVRFSTGSARWPRSTFWRSTLTGKRTWSRRPIGPSSATSTR